MRTSLPTRSLLCRRGPDLLAAGLLSSPAKLSFGIHCVALTLAGPDQSGSDQIGLTVIVLNAQDNSINGACFLSDIVSEIGGGKDSST